MTVFPPAPTVLRFTRRAVSELIQRTTQVARQRSGGLSMSKMNAEGTESPQSQAHQAQDNCYLKIWGDPTPWLSPKYGLVSLPHEDTTGIFIYEYFWTL